MKVIDPGHIYELDILDGYLVRGGGHLRFIRWPDYPHNQQSPHPGTTSQEVIRALIDRVQYLDQKQPSRHNVTVVDSLRIALLALEMQACEQRGRHGKRLISVPEEIELAPTCKVCGHIQCAEHS
ncbi:MAG TPA: hypothetical protein VHA37_01830 [Candidatus Saccharimonadales bacterium]|nr:hypothetical protein [Candidatus Saccharimonadales bacterium]